MPDNTDKIIRLLEFIAALTASTAVVLGAIQSVFGNRKTVKNLKAEVEKLKNETEDLKSAQKELERRTERGIDKMIDMYFNGRTLK